MKASIALDSGTSNFAVQAIKKNSIKFCMSIRPYKAYKSKSGSFFMTVELRCKA